MNTFGPAVKNYVVVYSPVATDTTTSRWRYSPNMSRTEALKYTMGLARKELMGFIVPRKAIDLYGLPEVGTEQDPDNDVFHWFTKAQVQELAQMMQAGVTSDKISGSDVKVDDKVNSTRIDMERMLTSYVVVFRVGTKEKFQWKYTTPESRYGALMALRQVWSSKRVGCVVSLEVLRRKGLPKTWTPVEWLTKMMMSEYFLILQNDRQYGAEFDAAGSAGLKNLELSSEKPSYKGFKEFISEAGSNCRSFNKRDETCRTGCKEKNVKPNSACPYDEIAQKGCKCNPENKT